ncbi:30S ribosomal protein S1 [Allofustis seminis]|uniref:30S ribosomal protein S1 n=1 Tax=Allofustis seminis TaxID=166939 RepID=UPI00035C91E2|nr:30S ribosomal protein S1 [Allofustis seminis]
MSEEKKDLEITEEHSMSEALSAADEIKPGDLVEGEVLAIDEDKNVVVGLSSGQEGIIPLRELSSKRIDNPADEVEMGETVEVVVLRAIADKEQGSFVLSKKRIDQRKVWDELAEKFQAGDTIEATVNRVVKGGVTVDVGVRGFVPASQLATHFVKDLKQFEGNTYEFKILELNPQERQLILSRRAILEVEEEKQREEALAQLEEGAIVKGTVVRLTNFGAFVDLGGIDGLVHISEIAHERVDKAEDKLSVGEEVEVKILSIDEDRERISLSIKDTLPGPWDNVDEEFAAGTVTKGIVKRIVDFGAFIELKPGVEGLVHISELAHRHVDTPHEVLSVGEEVEVKVLSVDPEKERVSLSIKALQEAPKREEKPVEKHVNVKQPTLRDENEESAFTLGDQIGDQLSSLLENTDNE